MILVARRGIQPLARGLEITLAVVLFSLWPLHQWYYAVTGTGTVDNLYPLHLCDLGAILGGVALVSKNRFTGEVLYFWGLAGTLQGVITPALTEDFPSPRYFMFFVMHIGVVITALYVMLGWRRAPRAMAKWKAWFLLNAYAVVVGGFNYLIGSNYGFLRRKPDSASLFDALGPWPWYIVVASLLGLVLFIVLDLPFIRSRRRI